MDKQGDILMKFYDLHCDTISAIYELRKQGKQAELSKNSLHLDLEKLQRGGYGLQTFALFVDKGEAEDCCHYHDFRNTDAWKHSPHNHKYGTMSLPPNPGRLACHGWSCHRKLIQYLDQ